MIQNNDLPSDTVGQIDFNPSAAIKTIDGWLDGAVALLPNLIVAITVFFIGWLFSRIIGSLISRRLAKRSRGDLGRMLGGLVKGAGLIGFGLIALSIVVPSIRPGDLVAGLGIGSVAIGFAFKDILQNWLAGFLILLRQPFEVGDQIVVDGFEGTVEHIETRSTRLKTYDGQRAIIPNSEVYTNAILVRTAYDLRRSEYDIGIGYADNIDEAREALIEATSSVTTVESDPAVEALTWDLAASWVTIRIRWWTNVRRHSIVNTKAEVIKAIKNMLDDKAIDMPYDTQVHLFHDQTEENDGDRTRQREGWPAGENPPKSLHASELERTQPKQDNKS